MEWIEFKNFNIYIKNTNIKLPNTLILQILNIKPTPKSFYVKSLVICSSQTIAFFTPPDLTYLIKKFHITAFTILQLTYSINLHYYKNAYKKGNFQVKILD